MALRAKKYFQDYDVEVGLKNGKEYHLYIYKGDLYARVLPERVRNKERIAYLVLAALACVLLLAAMLQPVASNMAGFFAAVSIVALIPAFCVAEGAVEAFFRKGDLTKGSYQERLVMLRVMPVLGAVLNGVMTVGYLLGLQQGIPAAAAMLCSAAAALCYAGLAVREFRVDYRVIKGARTTGEDAAAPREQTENEGDGLYE